MEENDKYEPAVSDDGGEAPASETASEVQALKEERDGLYDRLLRKQAEFENFKKRVDRERTEFVQFASAELMRELLNVLDSFDRALQNTGGDLRGFELIYKQLQDTMLRFGLKTIEPIGQQFDPNFHQSVATKATDEVEENTVVEEMRKGYTLNGRLLRPAMVTVSTKKE
jgi:molecular chaperone GrpE